jgi:hypothetical protein
MSKAGKSEGTLVGGLGREHPSPDTIPHLAQQTSHSGSISGPSGGGPALIPTVSQTHAGSPVKESSILQRGMSVDEQDGEEIAKAVTSGEKKGDEPAGVPIRQ